MPLIRTLDELKLLARNVIRKKAPKIQNKYMSDALANISDLDDMLEGIYTELLNLDENLGSFYELEVIVEPPGDNCNTGGYRLDLIDTKLEEIVSTGYICIPKTNNYILIRLLLDPYSAPEVLNTHNSLNLNSTDITILQQTPDSYEITIGNLVFPVNSTYLFVQVQKGEAIADISSSGAGKLFLSFLDGFGEYFGYTGEVFIRIDIP
jgi:hypothetical protein